MIHNILPTQIVVKHTEKWPSHNFGDRVQATDYKITGLKYYLGTIQRRNNKTKEIDYVTYQIKFDDGEVINNVLPFYIQKIFIPWFFCLRNTMIIKIYMWEKILVLCACIFGG